jgi:hypothetical protein
MSQEQTKTIGDLRSTLFECIEGVRNGTLDLEKAKSINEIAKTIVETAKVEVDYLRINNGGASPFIEAIGDDNLPPGITGRTVHRMR